MKKQNYLLWGFVLLIFGIVNSCRNDYLHEQQQQNDIRNNQLTSKIISLSQSKHKKKLLLKLKSTDNKLKPASSQNALAKVVNYADSVSIDTDRVIYSENENYHNYIFRIDRSNPIEGEPFENLLLTPLPDGSYKEFLVLYYITKQELQSFENGSWQIPKNRIKVVELLPGTYNNGQLTQTLNVNCTWTTVLFGYLPCSQNQHFNGEGSGICDAPKINNDDGTPGFLSQAVYGSYWECTEAPIDESIYPTNPPGDQGGGSSGTGNGTEGPTSQCVEVPTNPNDPSTGIGENGECETIIPIIPNLPNPEIRNPCNQLKTLKEKPVFQNKMSTLKGNINTGTKEKGFMFHTDSDPSKEFSPVLEGGSPYNPEDINFEPYMQSINLDLLSRTYGSGHNHLANHPTHIGVPTPEDLNQLLLYGVIETHVDNPYRSDIPTKAIVMVPTKIGIFALKINDIDKLKIFIKKYMKDWNGNDVKKFMEDWFQNTDKYNITPIATHDEQVTGFLRFMNDEDLGIDLYEGDIGTLGNWRKLELVNNGNGNYSYNQTPCNL